MSYSQKFKYVFTYLRITVLTYFQISNTFLRIFREKKRTKSQYKCKYSLKKIKIADGPTVFENHRKSLIQHYYERSELRLHFERTKTNQKCQKRFILASFWKPEACGQTELPDRSALIGQKLAENAKIQKFKCDILGDF